MSVATFFDCLLSRDSTHDFAPQFAYVHDLRCRRGSPARFRAGS